MGSEPDPRFTFANERTFLAWIRTALGFLAAGVAIAAVARLAGPLGLEIRVASMVLIICGLVCGVGAFTPLDAQRAGDAARPAAAVVADAVDLDRGRGAGGPAGARGGEPGMTIAPWDPGLQNERTGLAWQRTMLSGLTCGLLVARLLAEVSVALAILTGLLALLSTAALGWLALRRFRGNARALPAQQPLGDARPQVLITGLVILTAFGGLLFALVV